MKITDFHGGKTNVEAPVGKHNGIYIYMAMDQNSVQKLNHRYSVLGYTWIYFIFSHLFLLPHVLPNLVIWWPRRPNCPTLVPGAALVVPWMRIDYCSCFYRLLIL